MPTLAENKGFLGRGWKFPIQFKRDYNSADLVQYEQDVQESISILLATVRGERIMRPDYGTTVRDMIFEPLDTTTATLISEEIKQAILKYEPRVFVDKIDAVQDTLQGYIELSIDYTIIATNTRHNLVYPFYINEATHAEI